MPFLRRARAFASWALASWQRLAGVAAAASLAAICGGLLFAWSGAYNVAASRDHWAITELLLRFGMENSVEARAPAAALPRPLDEDAVRLGAGHFQQGCSFCHGAPGLPPSPVALRMLPAPPDLREKAPLWKDGELFWIVRHGLKYAGMPGWPSRGRDDEVWTLVAFLRRLPDLDAAGYAALALNGGSSADATLRETCARCHGDGNPPPSLLVPTLQGQLPERLAAALRAYRAGERDSGVMQTAAARLSDAEIERLAAAYAALPAPPRALQPILSPWRAARRLRRPASQRAACRPASPATVPAHARIIRASMASRAVISQASSRHGATASTIAARPDASWRRSLAC